MTNKGNKSEIAYQKVTALGKQVVALLESPMSVKLLENKIVIYSKIFGILNVAIKLFLRQNINTFSNKLYFDMLREHILQLKADYAKSKAEILKKHQGESKYRYQLTKMNDLIKDVEELAKKFKQKKDANIGKLMAEKLTIIQNNLTLRPYASTEVALLPAIDKARRSAIRTKHVEAIYTETIVPLMKLLVKAEALDAEKAKKIQQYLLNIAKKGHIENPEKKFDASILLSYGPKEVVLNDAKTFGFQGNVGVQFTELLTAGKTIETKFESAGDYISNFKLAVRSLKESEKMVQTQGKKIFYVAFLKKVLDDNKELAKNLSKLLLKTIADLEKEGAKEKEVAKMKKDVTEIGEVVETFYGSTYNFNLRRVKDANGTTSHLRLSIEEKASEAPAYNPVKVKPATPAKTQAKVPNNLRDL